MAHTATEGREARDPELTRALNRLGRAEIEAALNWGGFATYDHESTDELREALALAIEGGDVDRAAVEGLTALERPDTCGCSHCWPMAVRGVA